MSKSTTKKANRTRAVNNKKKPLKQSVVHMQVLRPDCAGIDIGDTMHAVAVPSDRDKDPVRSFGAFTCDLKEIVSWLQLCKVNSVAMESTGVYWKPLYALLISEGFEVYLVNAKQTKNVSGRKTDMSDAAWIQMLHSCGLLKSSFLPDDLTETVRTLVRQRKALLHDSSRCIQRIQKNLELMNLKIHTVISDITGKTGKAILEAIILGERKPENFLPLIDERIKATEEDILKSLEGNWRCECVFLVKQCYLQYQELRAHISACDKEIESLLQQWAAVANKGIIEPVAAQQNQDEEVENKNNKEQGDVLIQKKKKKKGEKNLKKKNKNNPYFDVRGYLKQIHGVDVLNIFGINEITALDVLSETGTDLCRWPTHNHFVSWLNLCPNNKITGGKLVSSMVMKKTPNNAAQAFRAAANGLSRSNNWLGDYFRRMRTKGGNKFAVVATARKLALIYYKMVRYKEEFIEVDMEGYKEKQKQATIGYLERRLAKLKGDTSETKAA